jgi:hypothetical protein
VARIVKGMSQNISEQRKNSRPVGTLGGVQAERRATHISAASKALIEEIDLAKANLQLGADLITTAAQLPENPQELPGTLYNALGIDDKELWPQVEQYGRQRLLQRATRQRLLSAERRFAQTQRQDLCAHYIDALCRLSETRRAVVGEEVYETLKGEYIEAKEAWAAVSGKPRTSRRDMASRTALPVEYDNA